ncbi:hypothetical protein FJU30_17360 [Affinibrenneria salicis]|uniref:Uncharacterized protein n=1 Tax=Affinibrenneria salicis TaxID=2590031 RepID=A0A5J5FXC6_9GAMM|nr:hypothetical protein [Affinibrenneria salicis]KAA8998181.1 hypothetical protein FJU30_17360 [Affinibrenneria salicis]
MTKIIRKSKVYVVAVSALFNSGIAVAKMNSTDIWSFIEKTSTAIENVTTQSIDSLPLPVTQVSENEYVNFYKGKDVTLSDSSKIMDIDLRLSKVSDGMAPFLSFSYSGHCLALNDIRKRYGELTLTDYPRGRSEDEMTSHTTPANKKGQKITFSFTEKGQNCLNKVIISNE